MSPREEVLLCTQGREGKGLLAVLMASGRSGLSEMGWDGSERVLPQTHATKGA
jgi:hypothetical protein